jgi:gamma-carbonic anhydrase
MYPEGVDARLKRFLDTPPQIDVTAYVSPYAVVQGAVRLAPETSVWPGAVLRADINAIEVGQGSNLQDGTIVHLSDDRGVKVGRYVTVGHAAVIHACEIGDECLVGMHATILDGARIGAQSVIGAGAVVTGETQVPEGSLVLGCPAKVVRALTSAERAELKSSALKYIEVAQGFKARGM